MTPLTELTTDILEGSKKMDRQAMMTVTLGTSDAVRIANYLIALGYRKVES